MGNSKSCVKKHSLIITLFHETILTYEQISQMDGVDSEVGFGSMFLRLAYGISYATFGGSVNQQMVLP
jgi:hypothetical protein